MKNHEMLPRYHDPEQPALPLDIRPTRTVFWLHAAATRRMFANGRRLRYVFEDGHSLPSQTVINADQIDEVKDSRLRYALRFADAANAVGWQHDGSGTKLSDYVFVTATNEGFDSVLLEAIYSGTTRDGVDTFLESLQSADPRGNTAQ